MRNFIYHTPTRVIFGKETHKRAGELARREGAKRVLVVYGGKTAKESGLLDEVLATLEAEGIPALTLGGVVPNPLISLARQGIEICREEGVDFLLAVGGGSVIDTAKAIAYGAVYDKDIWDLFEQKEKPAGALPVGVVLTLAAAGSEMSNSCVMTNDETGVKRGLNNQFGRCRFAIMNPELTLSVGPYQTAVGCADIVMHTLERYFDPEEPMSTTQEVSEALLRTTMANARALTRYPENYDTRADIMWAGSLSHNDLTGAGGSGGDWACHQLSHVLSAKYGLAHGAALTAVWSSWAKYVYKDHTERFARFAVEVMELEPQDDLAALAEAGIEEMEEFFWALELPTSLGEAELEVSDAEVKELARMCTYDGKRTIGSMKVLGEKEIAEIFRMAR